MCVCVCVCLFPFVCVCMIHVLFNFGLNLYRLHWYRCFETFNYTNVVEVNLK